MKYPDFLGGAESLIWADGNEPDYVSLIEAPKDRDALSQWIDTHFIPWYHEKMGYQHNDPISLAESWGGDPSRGRGHGDRTELPLHYYPDSVASRFVHTASTVLSCLWPILGILVLYQVKSSLARIGFIMVFTALFSLSVVLTTTARKVDTFVSTAAFAAVLVVFVGGDTSGCACSEATAQTMSTL